MGFLSIVAIVAKDFVIQNMESLAAICTLAENRRRSTHARSNADREHAAAICSHDSSPSQLNSGSYMALSIDDARALVRHL